MTIPKHMEGTKYESLGFRIFAGGTILCVLVVIVAGLWLAGSPMKERARRADAARLSSMQAISNAVDQYYNAIKTLPPDLETLAQARESYLYGSINDPETDLVYEYAITGKDTYQLCATFAMASEDDPQKVRPYEPTGTRFWEHGAGRHCFSITAQTYPR